MYGSEPWDGPKCLREMLAIPEEMLEFVADYPMHLVEIRKANCEGEERLIFGMNKNGLSAEQIASATGKDVKKFRISL